MNNFNRLISHLLESKQVGILYHNTNLDALIKILKSNRLEAFSNPENNMINYRNDASNINSDYDDYGDEEGDDYGDEEGDDRYSDVNKYPRSISFTRSKKYNLDPANIQIVVNGDKLSYRYKIVPYSHLGGRTYDEMEEKVYNNIDNVDKYIVKVIFPYELHSEPLVADRLDIAEALLKEKNIPYEFKSILSSS